MGRSLGCFAKTSSSNALKRLVRLVNVNYDKKPLVSSKGVRIEYSKLRCIIPRMKHQYEYISPDSSRFFQWITSPTHDTPFIAIAVIDSQFVNSINAKSTVLLLSSDTAMKQRNHHPELTADDYSVLSRINSADAMFVEGDHEIVFFYVSQTLYKAAIKRTKSGDAIFLTSFHVAKKKYLEDKRKKSKTLFDKIK